MVVADRGDCAISATIAAVFTDWGFFFIWEAFLFNYYCYLGEEKAEDKDGK